MREPSGRFAGELSVEAIGVAVAEHPGHRPIAAIDDPAYAELLAGLLVDCTGVAPERLWLLPPDHEAGDVGLRALAALGAPAADEPLFLVRSGPLRDPYVAELARLVHATGWPGEDVGVTHLDELGGTLVFELLSWAAPAVATALVCDEPVFVDPDLPAAPLSAVGLRVRRGPGPLRVLGCGRGRVGAGAADHVFAGPGPCAAWLALHDALASGGVEDGESLLLEASAATGGGWLLMQAVDVEGVLLPDVARTGSRVA